MASVSSSLSLFNPLYQQPFIKVSKSLCMTKFNGDLSIPILLNFPVNNLWLYPVQQEE
jgi:hypothetical protein